MLCAGAYVPSDFRIVRAYPDKMFCWGYFPETKHYDIEKLLADKGFVTESGERLPYLLWSGRMIDWKHPELVLETAKYLKERGIRFHMDMIGGGAMEDQMKQMARELALEEQVSFPGFMKPEEVRKYMELADIYLLTSDRQEGWGAVANEAMNSGCALVADHMVGAVPYLVRHGENGMIYRDGRKKDLFNAVEDLIKEAQTRKQMGRKAYETITDTWNAENAAECLCELIQRIETTKGGVVYSRKAEDILIREQGLTPCMPAPVIPERKMFKSIVK